MAVESRRKTQSRCPANIPIGCCCAFDSDPRSDCRGVDRTHILRQHHKSPSPTLAQLQHASTRRRCHGTLGWRLRNVDSSLRNDWFSSAIGCRSPPTSRHVAFAPRFNWRPTVAPPTPRERGANRTRAECASETNARRETRVVSKLGSRCGMTGLWPDSPRGLDTTIPACSENSHFDREALTRKSRTWTECGLRVLSACMSWPGQVVGSAGAKSPNPHRVNL